jgi:phenylpropionate dioxygenase-like ring-hydroxylating dioxygenase large terminal subunit
MRHDEQVRLIKQLCVHLDGDTNVDAGGLRRNPTSVYTDPAQADHEWTEWFRGMPQIVGLSGDLAEPGSFLTNNDYGTPILATRDDGGELKAFVNSCRHRGAIVETDERGTKRRFTCPFHAWSYDSAGALVGLPKPGHFGDVDKTCMGLRALPAEERHGLLFVHPDPGGVIDLDWLLGEWFNDEFSTWGFDELELLTSDAYDTDCNWKLAMDTFGETYHFAALHSDTLALSFHGNVQCYDEEDHLHRMVLCKRAIDDMRRLPEEEWDITVAGLPVYWIFPNVILMPFEIGLFLVRAVPVPGEPGRHVSRIDFYLRPAAVKANAHIIAAADMQEMAANIARTFSEVIRDEDYVMSSSQQTAANAGALDQIVFGRNEPALHHYHNTYRSMLGQDLLPLVERITANG